jgi:hypothetical protein
MTEVLAETMMDEAIGRRQVPAPLGYKTREVMARVDDAVLAMVKDYGARGGVLMARRYVTAEAFFQVLRKHWHIRFAKPIAQTPTVIDGLPQRELLARLAVSAQAVRDLLESDNQVIRKEVVDGRPCYVIDEKYLEPFCVSAANSVYAAFQKPDDVVHKRVHGEEVDAG